jgi:hypothetical protein
MHRLRLSLGGEGNSPVAKRSRHWLKRICDEWLRVCPLRVARSEPDIRTLAAANAGIDSFEACEVDIQFIHANYSH